MGVTKSPIYRTVMGDRKASRTIGMLNLTNRLQESIHNAWIKLPSTLRLNLLYSFMPRPGVFIGTCVSERIEYVCNGHDTPC